MNKHHAQLAPRHFGKEPWGLSAIWPERLYVATPAGEECLYCGELITSGDSGVLIPAGHPRRAGPMHRECYIVVRYGYDKPHYVAKVAPTPLTRRDFARAAMKIHEEIAVGQIGLKTPKGNTKG